MSKLAEFRQLEKDLAEQLAALESLKNDSTLQQEIEFESKLRALLGEYGYSLRDVIQLLDPDAGTRRALAGSAAQKSTRQPRRLKVYQNPHTGELIETKGGNHRGLKAWKEQYGGDTVESWLKA